MTHPFYLAAVPDAWEILGVKLRPFSLGHVVLLNRIQSAFLAGGVPDFNDLASSIFICSKTYREALAVMENPNISKAMRSWACRLTGLTDWRVIIGLRKCRPIDLAKSVEAFQEYIQEHSKIPDYDFNPAYFRDMHCPEVQMVKVTLMREMGFSESEIMDRPWGACLWDYVTLRALDGKVKMIDGELKQEALNTANELKALIDSGKLKIQTR